MIEDPPLLTIARNPRRLPGEIAAMFANTPTSFIVDAMGGRGALDWRIKPVGDCPALRGFGPDLSLRTGR